MNMVEPLHSEFEIIQYIHTPLHGHTCMEGRERAVCRAQNKIEDGHTPEERVSAKEKMAETLTKANTLLQNANTQRTHKYIRTHTHTHTRNNGKLTFLVFLSSHLKHCKLSIGIEMLTTHFFLLSFGPYSPIFFFLF